MASEKVRTLYIDHQIIAKETNWPQLLTVLAQHKSLRLVVSIYNLIEISAATDKAKAIKRAEFIDSLHPAWILERFMVEKNEVQNFVYQYYLKKPYTPPSVFADHLSTALSYHLRSRVILGMNARKWLDHFVNPEELKPLKQRTVESLITVQTASARQKKAIEGDLFREWIIQKIPLSDPDGKLFTKEEIARIGEYCWSARSKFYHSCRAMFAEHCLCQVRTSDPKRPPKESDMLDLQHLTLGLSYCDFLVTSDGYAYQCGTAASLGV